MTENTAQQAAGETAISSLLERAAALFDEAAKLYKAAANATDPAEFKRLRKLADQWERAGDLTVLAAS